MNENLHDIDKLFRDCIEGHEEAVPPAVWEGVSNDLDKQQASYYKDKYHRLKRWGLLLLLAGGLTMVYIVTKVVSNKDQGVAKVQTVPLMRDTDSTGANDSGENKYSNENVIDNYTNNGNPSHETNSIVGNADDLKTEKSSSDTIAATYMDLQTNIKSRRETFAKKNKTNVEVLPRRDKKQNEMPTKESRVRREEKLISKKSSNTILLTVNAKKNKSTNKAIAKQSLAFANRKHSEDQPSRNSKSSLDRTKLASVNLITGTNLNLLAITLIPLKPVTKNNLPDNKPAFQAKAVTAHGFSVAAFASPNFSFDRLEDDERLSGPGRNRHDAHKEEEQNVSFTGGLLVSYGLTKKLILQSGVTITSSTSTIVPKKVYAKADNNGGTRYELYCSSGYSYIAAKNGVQPAVGDSANTSGSKSRLTYISIPASVNLQITKGRFSFYPGIGAGLNFLTSGRTETELAGESSVSNISGLKSSYLDGRVSLGAEYSLTPKISIGLRPTARIALTPINKETPVKSYQNYLNIETGLRIKL